MQNGYHGNLKTDCCGEMVIHEGEDGGVAAPLVDGLTATRAAEMFKALSDPTRIRILSALVQQELCVFDVAILLNMSQSAISHQLRLLRMLGLVRRRKEGRVAFYTLDDAHVEQMLRVGLEHVSHG